jgi:hypothetical protein
VVARCDVGSPLAIAVAPLLEDGSPFPTTFWLTCPRLTDAVGALESAGEGARYADRARSDPALAEALTVANAAYREARRAEGGGHDPCAGVGVAGQRDPLAVKCLHARLAAHLAEIPDPVGASVARRVLPQESGSCADPRCTAPDGRDC